MGVGRKRTHGWPSRLPPVPEWVDRYAESALISAVRLRRYWIMQGDDPRKATEKAIRQAVGMMASSGVPLSRLIELFQELKNAADAFIKMLKNVEVELILDKEIEYLFRYIGNEPYNMDDYNEKRKQLTLKLKELLEGLGYREAYETLKSKRGFTPSDQLLRYSSKAFKRIVNALVTTVKSQHMLSSIKERELKKKILLTIAEVKYGLERAKQLEREAHEYATAWLK